MAKVDGQQVSIRENTVKSGGLVSVTPNSNISDITMIDTLIAKQQAQTLMERTLINLSEYGATNVMPGQQANIKHLNVGLGLGTWITVEADLRFSNTTDAVLTAHQEFPFNLIKRFVTEFNGNNIIHNMTGYQIFINMCKRKPDMLQIDRANASTWYNTVINTLPQVASFTDGTMTSSTVSPANPGDGRKQTFCNNVATVTVSDTKPLKFFFNIYVPFTLRDDIPIGMVPLQNNNIHAQMIFTINDIVSNNLSAANVSAGKFTTCFGTTDSATLDLDNSSILIKPCLEYMSIPNPMMMSDGRVLSSEALYGYFTNTSYILQNIDTQTVNSGVNAFNFSIPNNFLLLAITATAHDNGALLDPYAVTDNWHLLVNNSLQLFRISTNRRRFMDSWYNRQVPLGVMRFDLTEGVDLRENNLNTVKWLNLYDVNNPVWRCDIDTSVSGALDWSILMESLVPQNIALV